MKLFNDKIQDLGHESWKSKANRDSMIEKSNGWRSLPRLSKCQFSEKNFYSESKDPKGNRKPNEAYGKGKSKEPSPYLLVDDDDDDNVIGYETPRSISFFPASASEIFLHVFSSSGFLVTAMYAVPCDPG